MKYFPRLAIIFIVASSLLLGGTILVPTCAAAAVPSTSAPQGVSFQIPGFSMRGDSTSWTIVVLLTLLTLLPALLLAMTPFVRILVIFHFLRRALGTQGTPTNQTLIGLSLFLTYFLMAPVGAAINQQAIVPLENGSVTVWQALDLGSEPLRHFMLQYTREKDLISTPLKILLFVVADGWNLVVGSMMRSFH
jgi:flagellar biosynthetic protein FliP